MRLGEEKGVIRHPDVTPRRLPKPIKVDNWPKRKREKAPVKQPAEPAKVGG